ncbi:MAG: hypothetical protein JWN05_3360 [Arthrobacter sp.]|jgi:hypothetical protein|nr:hypothetical protein [Arthrobacter sp.]
MTRLFNEPAAFADEMIEGFVASHSHWVARRLASERLRCTFDESSAAAGKVTLSKDYEGDTSS